MHALEISDDELSKLMTEAATLAVEYWRTLPDRPSYPETSAAETSSLFSRPWPEDGRGGEVLDEFKTIAAHSRPSSGRFFGYVVGSGEPVGAVGDLLASVLNQNVTSWRSAPAAATIERSVIGWLATAIGCEGFGGNLCGGGSAANMMGLAMAREAKLPANEVGARPGIVYASEQVHMSIDKAMALIGLGRRNLRLVAVDDDSRMRPDALATAIGADRAAGLTPLAIVASAGAVATGAVDPIADISQIAAREGLWLHIDGAFGVLAAMAAPQIFEGLKAADSLSLDAHKWLYQPIDCGCLLHRHPAVAHQTFSHSGDYIKVFNADPLEAFAFFDESPELTRRFRALKLWLSLQYHGRRAFRDSIRRDLDHAQMLGDFIRGEPELELLAPIQLSAVCFRHRSKDNSALLQRINARGRVYLSNATIRGQFALRACFVNHRTRREDAKLIVAEALAAAAQLNA